MGSHRIPKMILEWNALGKSRKENLGKWKDVVIRTMILKWNAECRRRNGEPKEECTDGMRYSDQQRLSEKD